MLQSRPRRGAARAGARAGRRAWKAAACAAAAAAAAGVLPHVRALDLPAVSDAGEKPSPAAAGGAPLAAGPQDPQGGAHQAEAPPPAQPPAGGAPPSVLLVASPEEPDIEGLYSLHAEKYNGIHQWASENDNRLFAAVDGSWLVTEDLAEMADNVGVIKSRRRCAYAGGSYCHPHEAGMWEHADGNGGWQRAPATTVAIPTPEQKAEAERRCGGGAEAASDPEPDAGTRSPIGRWRYAHGVYEILEGEGGKMKYREVLQPTGQVLTGDIHRTPEAGLLAAPPQFEGGYVVLFDNGGALWMHMSGGNQINSYYKADPRSPERGFIATARRAAPPPAGESGGSGNAEDVLEILTDFTKPAVTSVSGCRHAVVRKVDAGKGAKEEDSTGAEAAGQRPAPPRCPLQGGTRVTVRGRDFGASGAEVWLLVRKPDAKGKSVAPERIACTDVVHEPEAPAEILSCALPALQPDWRLDLVVVAAGSDGELYESVLRGALRTQPADRERLRTLNVTDFQELGVGGLGPEIAQLFRRAFASRLQDPAMMKRLGIRHVRGIMLHGPPGTGKTLLARKIGELLGAKHVHTINGPEIMSKYVGQSEQNLRKIFKTALENVPDDPDDEQQHIVIFDEIDAVMKQRGGSGGDDSAARRVYDGMTTQLLSLMDGMSGSGNILVFGLTNRMDVIDPALLRPGRFEVQIKMPLPDLKGRLEIFIIHTKALREENFLAPDVDLMQLARDTPSYTGADIEGVVKSATSFALGEVSADAVEQEGVLVTMLHFRRALREVQPSHGSAAALDRYLQRGILHYSPEFTGLLKSFDKFVHQVRVGRRTRLLRVLVEGRPESGLTAVASYAAKRSGFPFLHLISMEDMVGLSETEKLQRIRDVFEDAYLVEQSCIVLDKLELLLEYSSIGRVSLVLQHALQQLLTRQPTGKGRLLVIVTTNSLDVLRFLNVQIWDVKVELPLLEKKHAHTALAELQVFEDEATVRRAVSQLPPRIGIKRLLWVVDQTRVRAGVDEDIHLRAVAPNQALPYWVGKTQFVVHPAVDPEGSTVRLASEDPEPYRERGSDWGWSSSIGKLATSLLGENKQGVAAEGDEAPRTGERSPFVSEADFVAVLQDAGLHVATTEALPTAYGSVML